MRRWWLALLVVTATACGSDGVAPSDPVPGDPTAAFPDPDDLPLISTTTTAVTVADGATTGGAGRVMGTPTTFRGVPPRSVRSTSTTVASAEDGGNPAPFEATARLSGADVVPPPGDPRGTGTARVRTTDSGLCVDVEVRSLFAEPTAAHLHQGVRGATGDVVMALRPPANGGTETTCADLDAATVAALVSDPARFYVDVHTGTNAEGAVRGQLAA